MRHRRRVKHFSRTSGPRKALIRGLVTSLVEHGRIKTTVAKAKELRRHVEKAVTLAKKANLNARRVLLAKYPNVEAVTKLFNDIAPRFKTRPGGYTRIIKIGRRPGDTTEMAFIEFVDYDYNTTSGTAEKKATKSTEKAEKAGTEKKVAKAKPEAKKVKKLVAAKKKATKTQQKRSRAAARSS